MPLPAVLNRRGMGIVLALVLLLGAALGVWHARRPPPEVGTLVLAYSGSLVDAPILVADAQGRFRAEGLTVQLKPFKAGKLSLEALLRGEADLATVAETPVVMQSFKRQDFVLLTSLVHFTTMQILVRKAVPARTLAELRGLRIGLMLGASPHYFLETLLRDLDMSPADYQAVDLRPDDFVPAMQTGRVDAIVAFQPMAYQAATALGEAVVGLPYERIRYQERFNLVGRRGLAQQQPQALQAFLRAVDGATQWVRSHPEEAKVLVAQRSGLPKAMLDSLWTQHKFGLGLSQGLLSGLEAQARWVVAGGRVPAGSPLPDYLGLLEPAPLLAVAPQSVTLIR